MDQSFDYNNSNPYQNPQSAYNGYYPLDFTPKTYIEKKATKKIANIIGAGCLIMLAIPNILYFGLMILAEVLRFLGIDAAFIADPAFNQLLQIAFSIFVFTVPFTLLFKVFSFRISDLISFSVPKGRDIIPYFLIGISFCTISNLTVSYLSGIFEGFGIKYETPDIALPQGIFGFILTFIATSIVPGLVEEFACRGLMLGALKKYGSGFAIITTAIVFGVLHGNFQQMPFAFMVGLVLGFITVKTGSIWISVFVHAFNNAISVVNQYLLVSFSETTQIVVLSLFFVLTLILGLVAVCILCARKEAYVLDKQDVSSTTGKLYLWFFTSPTIIIFIILNLIESLAYFKI